MPEENDPQNSPTTTEQSPPSQPPTTEPESPQRGAYSSGLRFSDDEPVEDWAKGKTPRELYELTRNVLASIPQQAQQQPQHQSTPPMQTPQGIQPPSQDLFYDNPEEWRRQQEAYQQYQINNSIQQASIPLLQSQAEMAKRASKEGENALIWQRWGPEIEALCAQMPLQLKANPQTWEEAVSIVRGRHYKELAQAEAERLAAGNGHAPMTERGSSTPDAPRGSDMRPLDKMFADNHPYAKRFKDAGLSAADIRARLPKMGYTGPDAEKNYVEAVTNSHIVLSGRESIAQAGAY